MASTSSVPSLAATSTPGQSDLAPSIQTQPAASVPGGFLKPASPRKRRRSLERTSSPAKTLEGQVQQKLDITSPTPAPIVLTGAGEMAEAKRRKLESQNEHINQGTGNQQSVNPRQQALGTLRGGNARPTSKPNDGPQSVAISASSAMSAAADANVSGSAQASPTSNSSFNTTTSTTAGAPRVASPTQIGDSDGPGDDDRGARDGGQGQQPTSPKSFTYPDPRLSAAQVSNHNGRNMSFPGSGAGDDTHSPSGNKKHKCPYCDTVFTRHHNLKSHLLTHSQEKPYLCQQCDMRFRRLHDLKRHTKLHTGERPHVCPRCNRKFARGDALARHTKGAGGCAGHRSSVGSFTQEAGGEGEIVMDGLMYAGEASQEPGEMDDNDGPSPRQLRPGQYPGTLQTPGRGGAPQTYPPIARAGSQHLHPHGAYASGNVSPASQHAPYGHPGQQGSYPPPGGYAPASGMTESPGPISPSAPNSATQHDPRRGSFNQLQQYTRPGAHGSTSSPQAGSAPTANMSLPPPAASLPSNAPPAASGPGGQYSHLPPPPPPPPGSSTSLPGLTDPRANSTHGHGGHGHGSYPPPPAAHSHPGGAGSSASTHNSLSSHGSGSGDRHALDIAERDRLYAIIGELRQTVSGLTERVNGLQEQVDSMKGHTAAVAAGGGRDGD